MDGTKSLLDVIENYIGQKLGLFKQLQSIGLEQAKLLQVEDIDLDAFEALLEVKDEPMQQLEDIEEAFSLTISVNQNLLSSGLESHKAQIDGIKAQLENLDYMLGDIRKVEENNKERLAKYFNYKRQDIRSFKKSKQAASKYTQNMSNTHQEETSYFMDRKK